MANDIIFGKNSVMEALIAGDREINKILISKTRTTKRNSLPIRCKRKIPTLCRI